ncbi:MAG TPA: TVP38/TMEM64 family protein [Pirellulaceae bacterium]|nr:TVP38/TMEM64 family protein [Pirellulaceae bacterium]HMO94065.1 TVP38/TMEM64 family protein [Pirellulaceae bacterium]HMP70929.1 TVP38/TMEM64 family protein [Pirellulaceae bacterium]
MPSDTESQAQPPLNRRKLVTLALVVVAAGCGFWLFGDRLSLESLARYESVLVAYRIDYPMLTLIAAISIYVVVAGLSLPAAAALTLASGWYFGFWLGLVVVSFGSTGGATLSFLLTRYFLRDWARQKFAHRFTAIDNAFEREGAFYLFTLRLIPAVPFFVINAVMGLTKIRAITFWWVSQLGMLPGTAAYVYAGSTIPSLRQLAEKGVGTVISWQLLLAFAILGLLPLVIKRIMASWSPSTTLKSNEFTQSR